MKDLKILIIDPSLFSLHYDIEFCNALAKKGGSITLIGRHLRKEEDVFLDDLSFKFVRLYYFFEKTYCRSRFRVVFKGIEHVLSSVIVLGYIVINRPSIVHFQWAPFALIDNVVIKIISFFRIKTVFTAHNSTPFHNSSSNKIQKLGWLKTLNIVDKVQVHSQFTYDRLIEVVGADKRRNYFVAPHGVLQIKTRSTALSSRLKQNKKYFNLLFFGHIKSYKGLDLLLDALNKRQGMDVFLTVAGKPGMDMTQIMQSSKKLLSEDRILYLLKYQKDGDLQKLIENSDCVIFPYREIDSSGALMLTVNAGVPVIVSSLNGLTEVINGGVYGYVFDKGDIDSLNCEIDCVMGDAGRLKKARAAKTWLDNNYGWNGISEQVMSEYMCLINKNRKSG